MELIWIRSGFELTPGKKGAYTNPEATRVVARLEKFFAAADEADTHD